MYQKRVRDALSPLTATAPDPVDSAMWALFLAIGEFWKLEDDTAGYRLRLRAFMANRVSLDPRYAGSYDLAARVIADLVTAHGEPKAYEIVFTQKPRGGEGAIPETDLATVQKHVADEFIAWRLALGGFSTFGATNYRGYFGGANLEDEPVPYRTRGPRP